MIDFRIFINIILYLLLALAFFSDYFIQGLIVKSDIVLVFIFGIFSLILLTIGYLLKLENNLWPYLFMTPFILTILHILTRMFYQSKINEEGMKGGWSFITGCIEIIKIFFKRKTLIVILMVMILISLGILSKFYFPN